MFQSTIPCFSVESTWYFSPVSSIFLSFLHPLSCFSLCAPPLCALFQHTHLRFCCSFYAFVVCSHVRFLPFFIPRATPYTNTLSILSSLASFILGPLQGIHCARHKEGLPFFPDYYWYSFALILNYVSVETLPLRIIKLLQLQIYRVLVFIGIYPCLPLCYYWFAVSKSLC